MTATNFEGLRQKLKQNKKWPLNYMFKFIVPNVNGNVDKVVALLPTYGKNSFKTTPNLKHVSVTCVAKMNSSDKIIAIMNAVAEIEGVMVL